jgi:hypothetical protein
VEPKVAKMLRRGNKNVIEEDRRAEYEFKK